MWSLLKVVVATPLRPTDDADDAAYYECRQCGTSVDGQNEACPYCEDSVVVGYDFR